YSIEVGGSGQFGAQVVIPYQLRLNCVGGGPPSPPGAVTYKTGWNLVGGPTGTTFPVPLFQYDPSVNNYKTIPANTPVTAGTGYWAYFTTATPVNLTGVSQTSAVVSVGAMQWTQVGNPSSTSNATVTAADAVFTYDPAAGQYSATNTLSPGQGAW